LAYQSNQGYLQSIHDPTFLYEVEEEVVENNIGQPGFGCRKGIYFYYNFETACGHERGTYPLITRKLGHRRRNVKPYKNVRPRPPQPLAILPPDEKQGGFVVPADDAVRQVRNEPFPSKTRLAKLCDHRSGLQKLFNRAAPMSITESLRQYKVMAGEFNGVD
jgi:hypothetical protein